MAAPYHKLVNVLRRWGNESAANKSELIAWKDSAIRALAEGGDIISGSGNGVNFAKQYSLNGTEWLAALDDALIYIEAGIAPTSRTYARII